MGKLVLNVNDDLTKEIRSMITAEVKNITRGVVSETIKSEVERVSKAFFEDRWQVQSIIRDAVKKDLGEKLPNKIEHEATKLVELAVKSVGSDEFKKNMKDDLEHYCDRHIKDSIKKVLYSKIAHQVNESLKD
jgi:hypothetical protein